MANRNVAPGANYAPAYQISGIPFVTSSNGLELSSTTIPTRVKFPTATRWIEVGVLGEGALNLGFSVAGVLGEGGSVSGSLSERSADHNNFLVVSGSGNTTRLELRCKEVFFLRSPASPAVGFTLVAGLTGIPAGSFPELSGSDGLVGVG